MLNKFREWVNLRLYNNKQAVLRAVKYLNFIAALLAIIDIAVLNGFTLDYAETKLLINVIRAILSYFVLSYLTRIFYSFHVNTFLRETWVEGALILFLIYDGISLLAFDVPLLENSLKAIGIEDYYYISLLLIQGYMMVLAFIELAKANWEFTRIDLKPSTSLILSLMFLLLTGTFLLMMPEMTTVAGSMPFFDALFTSVSAISQTGLIVVDTGSYFTFKGLLVIMVLIQIGAIGIVSFGTFFGARLASNIGLKKQYSFHDFFVADNDVNTTSLFSRIIYYTLTIDLIGAILIFFLVGNNIYFESLGDKIFFAIFHSVSAFCNAGFSTLPQGLYDDQIRYAYLLHIGIFFLVYFGSVGYPSLIDMSNLQRIKTRMGSTWKKLHIDTRISLYTSLALVGFGALVFFALEYNNTLAGQSEGGKWVGAFFQSVTRTAGFNTVDISALTVPSMLLLCFLMFIGGSSGSVCGGIRTSTFLITILSMIAILRGRTTIDLWGRRIPNDVFYRVISIVLFAGLFVFVTSFALTLTDPDIPLIQLVFEEISAFGTVGLTTGITSDLSFGGKIILVISMFVGRVGTLTLAYALTSKMLSSNHKYPETNIMIG